MQFYGDREVKLGLRSQWIIDQKKYYLYDQDCPAKFDKALKEGLY